MLTEHRAGSINDIELMKLIEVTWLEVLNGQFDPDIFEQLQRNRTLRGQHESCRLFRAVMFPAESIQLNAVATGRTGSQGLAARKTSAGGFPTGFRFPGRSGRFVC